MLAIVFVIAVAIIAALVVFLAGRAMGPAVISRKFDETPADVIGLDVSDGTPIWTATKGQVASESDIALMEKFSDAMRSERRP